jgi:hypothetical protein
MIRGAAEAIGRILRCDEIRLSRGPPMPHRKMICIGGVKRKWLQSKETRMVRGKNKAQFGWNVVL